MKLCVKDVIISLNDNLSIIYYEDYVLFNEFLSELKSNLNKGNYYFLDNEFLFDDLIWIDMNIDLKKDFSLGKTSSLRKEIIKIINDFLENKNLDVNDLFNNTIIDKISEYITTQISSDKFKILLNNKNKVASNIVDNIFEPLIVNDSDEEIYLEKFNQWNLSEIYLEMLLGKDEVKNKLIIINDYDQYIINDSKILKRIEQLKENNLVVLTTRNNTFFNKYDYMNSLSIFMNSDLNKVIFNNKIFEKQFLIKDFDRDVLEFDAYEINASYLVEEDDVMRMKMNVSYALKSIFKELFYEKEIDVSYFNEFVYLSLLFILEDNRSVFKSKLVYKGKLSDISKYILNKYYEN